MANVDVVDLGGQKVGSIELAEEVFGPSQANEALLWEAVKHYRAALRQGTAATKNKKLVSGAGKKLWKQKGTGRARVWARSVRLFGGTGGRFTDRSLVRMTMRFRARRSSVRLRAALSGQVGRWQADGGREPGIE